MDGNEPMGQGCPAAAALLSGKCRTFPFSTSYFDIFLFSIFVVEQFGGVVVFAAWTVSRSVAQSPSVDISVLSVREVLADNRGDMCFPEVIDVVPADRGLRTDSM